MLKLNLNSKTAYRVINLLGIIVIFYSALLLGKKINLIQEKESLLNFKTSVVTFENNINSYVYGLQGMKGIVKIKNFSFSNDDLENYSEGRDNFKNFIGVIAFGFIRKIEKSHLANYIENQKKLNTNFNFRQLHDKNFQDLYIVENIAPIAPNKLALGLDIGSENSRREGLINAINSGQATITKEIQLVQLNKKEPGYLIYLPLYQSIKTPNTLQERQKEFVGAVYAPVVASALSEFIASHYSSLLKINIKMDGSSEFFMKSFDEKKDAPSFKNELNSLGVKWRITAISNHVSVELIYFSAFLLAVLLSFVFTYLLKFFKNLNRDKLAFEQKASGFEALVSDQQILLMNSAKLSALGEMAAGIAHEINNPLAIIQGNVSLMIEKLKNGPVPEDKILASFEKIASTSDRIGKIIKSLQSISRNGNSDERDLVSMRALLDEVLVLSIQKLKINDVGLTLNFPVDDILIKCSKTQIFQVLVNLINNAFDAVITLEEKWIMIDVKLIDQNNFMECSVTDSGSGIPENVAQKLMQPFFTTKGIGKGTGLGLSISRGIIQNHKGRFYLDQTSKNTRFVFNIGSMK